MNHLPDLSEMLNHGAIGNGRVIALVSPTSAIEWLCLPRFDSPSLFARILDRKEGGWFGFEPESGEKVGNQHYITNTNVLRTEFDDGENAWEIIDFAPRIPNGLGVDSPIEIIRLVQPLRGRPIIRVKFDPRPDYGRGKAQIMPHGAGVEVQNCGVPVHLLTNAPLPFVLSGHTFSLDRPHWFVLRCGAMTGANCAPDVHHLLEQTVAGWRAWAKSCALPTFAPEAVLRSALVLKLCTYEDTGAIIAAATTSIPEAIGTERTWDYRYCWLRDAAFVVEALRRIGHLNEGERFIRFLRDVAEAGPLQPLYGIGGETHLPEEILDHLSGFGGTKPVRVGNAAAEQRQNDLMGELVLCLVTVLTDPRLVIEDKIAGYFPLIRRLVEESIAAAPTLDMGIWEFRTMMRPYTFSRAMCWVAISRGALVAKSFGYDELAAEWEAIADKERAIILERAYNEEQGYFTQVLDGQHADASNLLLATLGIVDPKDKRFVSTVTAYGERLTSKGLMRRYSSLDDFGETHSAFTICSFWWAEALALIGQLDEAVTLFNHLMTFANPLGLFSEDIDPESGRLLGNFPQSYTHVGLIHAAMTISELLEARDGKVRAWT